MKNPNFSIAVIIKIIKLFTSWQIEESAREVGFTQRERGLAATTFFKAFTVGAWELHEITLETLASNCCEMQHGLQLTRQALFQRLKIGSTFMKKMLGWTVAYAAKYSVTTETIEVLKQFKHVYLCDSTLLSLPDKLQQVFKGLGGTNAKAAVRIQAMFSLMERKFKSIELCSATVNDSNYTSGIAQELSFMDLVLFDLGYFSIDAFKEIVQRGASLIRRVKNNTQFYVDSVKKRGRHTRIDILKLLRESGGIVDQWIYIGGNSKTRMKVRLVAIRLPDDVVNERRRKANKKTKAADKTLKDVEIELLAWNIFIINILEDMLSAKTVCETYRLRWQAELIFKSWKSYFDIDNMVNVGEKYLQCLLYGKLIVITLMTAMYSGIYSRVFRQQKRSISMLRFFKNLREKAELLLQSLQNIWGNMRIL